MNSSACTSWIAGPPPPPPPLTGQIYTVGVSESDGGQGLNIGRGLDVALGDHVVQVTALYWLRMVAMGFTLFILCTLTIMGNAMVLHAVRTDRRLQTVSNMFIVSLAIADLIVGIVVMPIGALYIFTEDWSFGLIVCQLWVSVDYTASTASILNLLILSLDRYWSVTMPLKYIRRRTKRRALLMISVVWFLSSLWLVPIIGWHHFYTSGVRTVPSGVCDTEYATNTALKIITGTLNYYLPLAIMYALYTRIFMEIRKRSKLEIGLRMCGGGGGGGGGVSGHRGGTTGGAASGATPIVPPMMQTSYSDESEPQTSTLLSVMKTTPEVASRSKKDDSRKADYRKLALSGCKDKSNKSKSNGDKSIRLNSPNCDEPDLRDLLTPRATEDSLAEPGRDLGRNEFSGSVLVPPCNGPSAPSADSGSSGDSALLKRAIKWRMRAERWQQHRRPSTALAREIKAARQLGVIMGAFTVCFFPYFVCFMVVAFCDGCISPPLMTTMTWIGYLNSTMNPFLYPMCNMNFRRKFRSMMSLSSRKDLDRRGIGALMMSVQNHSVRCSAPQRQGFH